MKKLLMLAVALLAPISIAPAETMALSDAEIIGVAQAINQAEMDAGRFAEERSSNSDVKSFAKLMVKTHTAPYTSLKNLAASQNITLQNSSLSDKMKADEEKHLESLDRQRGILFDLDYANHEVEFHQKMVHIWDEKLIPNASNEELKRLLADMRASNASHLEDAKKLKSSLGRKK